MSSEWEQHQDHPCTQSCCNACPVQPGQVVPQPLSPDSKSIWSQVFGLDKQGRPCTTTLCYQSISKRWAGALALSRPFHLRPASIFKAQEQSFQAAASVFSHPPSQLDAHASWILRFLWLFNEKVRTIYTLHKLFP